MGVGESGGVLAGTTGWGGQGRRRCGERRRLQGRCWSEAEERGGFDGRARREGCLEHREWGESTRKSTAYFLEGIISGSVLYG